MKTFTPGPKITLYELWVLRDTIQALVRSTDVHYFVPAEAVSVGITGRNKRPGRRTYEILKCEYDPNLAVVLHNSLGHIIALGKPKQIYVADFPTRDVAVADWAVAKMSEAYPPFQARLVAWDAPTTIPFVQMVLGKMHEDLFPVGVVPEWKGHVGIVFPVRTREFASHRLVARWGQLSVWETGPGEIVPVERERVQVSDYTVWFPGSVEGVAVLDMKRPHGYHAGKPAWYVRTGSSKMVVLGPDGEAEIDLPDGVKRLILVWHGEKGET